MTDTERAAPGMRVILVLSLLVWVLLGAALAWGLGWNPAALIPTLRAAVGR